MQQGIDYTLPGIEGALDRFEKLFQDLNAMLCCKRKARVLTPRAFPTQSLED
jgi:hypothetical protein